MRVPLSWLRELVALPDKVTGREVAAVLVRAGLEVETVEIVGGEVTGPVLTGRVLEIEEFTASNGKTIRWCQVDVGESEARGIVCGARNFAVGDTVVVTLPGAVLPGGFEIAARKTYGHVSDGMIASTRELGIGEDRDGILVLAQGTPVGADALDVLGMRDEVLDIAVTPDRGYCLSMRGVAREAATGFGVPFADPALGVTLPDDDVPSEGTDPGAHPGSIADPTAAARLILRSVHGVDPTAATPSWMAARLRACGMRPISLSVDVTNYVMLELGQPLHAFDRAKLGGPIEIRRAHAGETLVTLDHVTRALDPEDVVVSDPGRPLALAGTMGGLDCEVDETTRDLVVEAAHFSAVAVARQSRRHKLSSEASRRFERGVDPMLPEVASARVVALLTELGGGHYVGTSTSGEPPATSTITVPADRAARVAGRVIDEVAVVRHLEAVGCAVKLESAPGDDTERALLHVTPPPWRPDLTDPADLDEEVLRLEGYDTIPSTLPHPPPGRGLTIAQRRRRRASIALAAAGYVEAPSYPFVAAEVWDQLSLPPTDTRRRALRLANPLSDSEPLLRTTLLPGLLRTLVRNVGRGQSDVALFETGMVFLAKPGAAVVPPRLTVARRPSLDEIAALEAALPDQPRHAAVVLVGDREPAGWWGPARPASWADPVAAARALADALHVELSVRAGSQAPWHPGRCAELVLADAVVGHAGELHPRVIAELALPPRTAAMEIDLDALVAASPEAITVSGVSSYPVAKEDVALVVADDVAAAVVEQSLREGGGDLLESVRLFDVYTGEQVPAGRRSLAFSMRLRAADRTLTAEEVLAVRKAAVARAAELTGAELRS